MRYDADVRVYRHMPGMPGDRDPVSIGKPQLAGE
jgi:hypothetical protein